MTRRLRAEASRARFVACVALAALAPRTAQADADCAARTDAFHASLGLEAHARRGIVLDAEETAVVTLPAVAGAAGCVRVDVLAPVAMTITAELYDDAGALHARDTRASASPSLAACGVHGPFHVALRAHDAPGRVVVVAASGPERVVRSASPAAPCAYGAEGVALGPYALAPSRGELPEARVRAALADEALAAGPIVTIEADAAGRAAVRLDGARGCRLALVAHDADADVMLTTEVPTGPAHAWLGAGVAMHLTCAVAGTVSLGFQVEGAAAARFAVAWLDVEIGARDVPAALSAEVLARFALVSASARARGMRPRVSSLARVGRDALVRAVPVASGACTLVVAGSDAGGLRLSITDADGRLLAQDASGAGVLHAWHCGEGEEEAANAWIERRMEGRVDVVYSVFSEAP